MTKQHVNGRAHLCVQSGIANQQLKVKIAMDIKARSPLNGATNTRARQLIRVDWRSGDFGDEYSGRGRLNKDGRRDQCPMILST
jgi:hypothetical protein